MYLLMLCFAMQLLSGCWEWLNRGRPMTDILRDTVERLIAALEDRRGKDQDIAALTRTLLAACEQRSTVTDVAPSRTRSLEVALEEARQAKTALFEQRRLLRVVREERDSLAVLTGQLLERAQKAEKLLALAPAGEARSQVLVRREEDAQATLLADPMQRHGTAGAH